MQFQIELKDKNQIEKTLFQFAEEIPILNEMGLYTGDSGLALFLSYFRTYLQDNRYDPTISSIIASNFDRLDKNLGHVALGAGITGFLWASRHLMISKKVALDINFEGIDAYLKTATLGMLEEENLDFIHGSDGLLFYLLDSASLESEFIKEVVSKMDIQANKKDKAYYWQDKWIPEKKNVDCANFSIAHGISSKIIILSELAQAFPNHTDEEKIVEKCITYLISKMDLQSKTSVFPAYDDFSNQFYGCRLAWCYGDFGVAIAIYRASKVFKNKNWEKLALEILIFCSKRRNPMENGISDVGICHGTAGIAHIFNRFYIETGITEFNEARLYWLKQTLNLISQGMISQNKNVKTHESLEHSFIEGKSGIGLALLGFLSPDKSLLSWDRCILLS